MINNVCSLNRITDSKSGPVVIYVSSDWDDSQAVEICNLVRDSIESSFVLFELKVYDWDKYLTPWQMKMGNRSFAGKAKVLLDIIENDIIPEIRNTVGVIENIYIAGYSLAGLFSLWSIYESDCFSGAVSCSGSLWYENWIEYVTTHSPRQKAKVYLSLGDKEKNSRNELMKTVEDKTIMQEKQLSNSSMVSSVIFEMNKGGHFTDVKERIAKGISAILL